jgi:hypothetical protein
MMLIVYPKDIADRRKVLLKGRVVTLINAAGSKVRIAEDGLWHETKELYELTNEHKVQLHLEGIKSLVAGKTIATLKSNGTGIQLVMEDNTRLDVTFAKDGEGLVFSVIDSDGKKVR